MFIRGCVVYVSYRDTAAEQSQRNVRIAGLLFLIRARDEARVLRHVTK